MKLCIKMQIVVGVESVGEASAHRIVHKIEEN